MSGIVAKGAYLVSDYQQYNKIVKILKKKMAEKWLFSLLGCNLYQRPARPL